MPTGFETAFKAGCNSKLNEMYKELTITQDPDFQISGVAIGRNIWGGHQWMYDVTDPASVSSGALSGTQNWYSPPEIPVVTYKNNNLTKILRIEYTSNSTESFDGLLGTTIIPDGIVTASEIESSITGVMNKAINLMEVEIGPAAFEVFSCHSSCHASCHRDGTIPEGVYVTSPASLSDVSEAISEVLQWF